jgi:rubrerythrin
VSTIPAFAPFDADGALEEAHDAARGRSRAAFLRATAGGALGLAALAAAPATARSATKNDIAILNYALGLEYLQAAFYTEAERGKAIRGPARAVLQRVGAVERAHVRALRDALGRAAAKRPFFDFRGATEDSDAFLRTAVAFEDLAAAAYKGQAPLIDSDAVLAAAISIHSVEARHAAWVRFLAGSTPAADALDEPLSKAQVRRLVKATRFVSAAPRTRSGRTPPFTG